jgi:hypothetical protein
MCSTARYGQLCGQKTASRKSGKRFIRSEDLVKAVLPIPESGLRLPDCTFPQPHCQVISSTENCTAINKEKGSGADACFMYVNCTKYYFNLVVNEKMTKLA